MEKLSRIMDIMHMPGDHPTISPEQTIQQAWQIINTHYQGGYWELQKSERLVLVINEENQLVGLLNSALIMKHLDENLYTIASRIPGGFLENEGAAIHLLPSRKVHDIMLPVDKIALKSTDTVSKALTILLNNNLGCLPVLNIYNQIIGIVHAGDVFHHHKLGSSFYKSAFMNYDYYRYGLFDDYYVHYDELKEKKGVPQRTQ